MRGAPPPISDKTSWCDAYIHLTILPIQQYILPATDTFSCCP